MNETLKKPKSKIPGSSSFVTLRTAVQDGLIVAKLQFLSSTATVMMPYLQKFQGNAPLVPFMTTEATVILEILMQKFIKQSELQAANSPDKIAKLYVVETGNSYTCQTVKEKKLSQLQIYEFKKEYCGILAPVVTKIQEISPLKYNFARKQAGLDPRLIVAEPDTAVKMLKQVLTILVDTKWRTTE